MLEYLVTNRQYNAHYINGHDHCMEHIKPDNSNVNHYLVGMGMMCCYDASNAASVPSGALKWYTAADNAGLSIRGGFAAFSINKGIGFVYHYYYYFNASFIFFFKFESTII